MTPPPRDGFDRVLRRVEDALAAVAATALLALAALMLLEVVLRYVLAAPMSWSLAFISDYLLVGFFFLGLPHTVRAGAHVRIDVLYQALPVALRRWCTAAGTALSALFVAALTWGGLALTGAAWAGGDVPPPGGAELSWPVWTSTVMVPLGGVVLLARLLHTLVVRPTEPPEDPDHDDAQVAVAEAL
ncbi:TRAP transporter small permease [Pseudonocardia kunmingensis]|uniref:TRAP-type C4-dicarboxylate transport system permease small subunit n=1 Tax=Pseudonocardia kunmingensis TaxID=630975 RepID=A0A543D1H5_9PSEU|nr:TRAP transporter small permease [Pseudonocardia kunmingensis]TQM03189.1 TRAP-type C4-dicarboxylate transport system permease small subunit [Pseudonocardia kunmingensis]